MKKLFFPSKLLIEKEIKLFNNFLVLKAMMTENQSMSAAQSFFHADLDGALSVAHPLESSQHKAFLEKSHPLTAVWILFRHHCSLALSQLWHVHYFKIHCPPSLRPHPTQLITKSQLRQHSIADLVKHVSSAGSLFTTQELSKEISAVEPSVWCLTAATQGGLPPSILHLKTYTYPNERSRSILGV